MNFLRLSDPAGIQPVFVNLLRVDSMRRPAGATSTGLYFSDGKIISVMETPEEIITLQRQYELH